MHGFNKLYDYIVYKQLKDGTYDIIESDTKRLKNITFDEFNKYNRKYEMSKYFHKFAVVQSKSKSTSTSSNFCLLN